MRPLRDARCCVPVDCSFMGWKSIATGILPSARQNRGTILQNICLLSFTERNFLRTGISNDAENPSIFKFNTWNVWDCWSDEETKWKREKYAGWAQLPERGFEDGYTLNVHIQFRMENSILRNHWVKTWLLTKNEHRKLALLCPRFLSSQLLGF